MNPLHPLDQEIIKMFRQLGVPIELFEDDASDDEKLKKQVDLLRKDNAKLNEDSKRLKNHIFELEQSNIHLSKLVDNQKEQIIKQGKTIAEFHEVKTEVDKLQNWLDLAKVSDESNIQKIEELRRQIATKTDTITGLREIIEKQQADFRSLQTRADMAQIVEEAALSDVETHLKRIAELQQQLEVQKGDYEQLTEIYTEVFAEALEINEVNEKLQAQVEKLKHQLKRQTDFAAELQAVVREQAELAVDLTEQIIQTQDARQGLENQIQDQQKFINSLKDSQHEIVQLQKENANLSFAANLLNGILYAKENKRDIKQLQIHPNATDVWTRIREKNKHLHTIPYVVEESLKSNCNVISKPQQVQNVVEGKQESSQREWRIVIFWLFVLGFCGVLGLLVGN